MRVPDAAPEYSMAWPHRFRSSRSTIGSLRSKISHDHLGPEPRQPRDEVGERHVAADDDLLGEGKAEHKVWRPIR